MKLEYTKVNGYYLPNLGLKNNEYKSLNKYGLMKLDYLKKNKKALYQQLLMKDELNEYLYSVGNEAENKVNILIKQLIEFDGTINEKLKETNQLLWVQKMKPLLMKLINLIIIAYCF